MRKTLAIPMIAAFALTACGSDADPSAEGEPIALEDAVEEMGEAEMPTPGQYRTTQELLDIELPGVDEQFVEMLRANFAEGAGEENTYCLTPEEAANGREEMLAGMAESDCTVTRFDVSGGNIDAAMSCPTGQGVSGDVTLTGTMDATSADMEMNFSASLPQMGDAKIRMRVQSERIGECS